MKRLGIVGCGWLGYRIAQHLQAYFEIHTTVTNHDKIDDLATAGLNPEVVNFDEAEIAKWCKLNQLDAIIITVPLFSRTVGEEILTERRENLLHFISGFKGPLILMSSIGVYKNTTGEVSEQCLLPNDVPGEREVCQTFPQITILRLGGLMGDDRQLKYYKVSEPDAPVNHVHYNDVVLVVQKLLDAPTTGRVFNVVAPLHPTKAAVICAQTGVIKDVPAATDGRIVSSGKLVGELDYNFLHPDPAYFHDNANSMEMGS